MPEWVSGVKTLLVGASTSFLLSFGDSLPSWCCLGSLLAAHILCVKSDQLELKGSCRGGFHQTPGEMQTCLPAFLGFPGHSVEQRQKKLRASCFKEQDRPHVSGSRKEMLVTVAEVN